MIVNGKQFGTPVEGTHVLRHGDAPRRSPADRNKMAWYECTCDSACDCDKFFCCRVADVKAGKQVSCGCVGRKQFTRHFEQRAANLLTAVKNEIFNLTHKSHRRWNRNTRRFGRWTERISRAAVARRFKLEKYVVDFVIADRCRLIRAVAKLGKYGWNLLSETERTWFRFQEAATRLKASETAEIAAVVSAFEALPMVERLKMIADERNMERKGEATSSAELQAMLQDPNVVVEIGPFGVTEVMNRWLVS